MSKYSFRRCETTKRINFFLNRNFILEYLEKRGKPIRSKKLITELNINDEKKIGSLQRLLYAMRKDGQLIFARHQCIALPKHLNLLKGIVIGHRDGYGFLRVKEYKYDFYLSSEEMKVCIHGDHVLAKPIGINKKGFHKAQIVHILIPKINKIIGRYFSNKEVNFVVPDDDRLNFDILIPSKGAVDVRVGCIVVVKLTKRPTRYTKAIGRIIEVLSNTVNTNMIINTALRTHAIPYVWTKKLEKEIAKFKKEIVSEESKINRVDLRKLPLITIDEEDACDLDDAVYCERKPNGNWKLWIAIADVSYYVRPNTLLDNEARNRGLSVYFSSQVIPMLPKVLSNSLCSLNPKVDRLCVACEIVLSKRGAIVSYKFYEAIINSHARLTYAKAWRILQGDKGLCEQYTQLIKQIEDLYNLYKILNRKRELRGGFSFKHEATKLILNKEQRVKRIEQVQYNDMHKLIEECMILANISAACFIEKAKEPALFRVHERPSIESIIAFRSVLTGLDLELLGGNNPEPHHYTELLKSIVSRSHYKIIQNALLRSMKKAIYSPKNRGHFGLALQYYTHFTSPIRRYPDILLHRAIKYLLALEKNKIIRNKDLATGGWHYSEEEISQLGKHCSMAEQRADEVTREVETWLKCDFMLNQVGNAFKGIISNVTFFGFFVLLDDFSVDGLVHISVLNDDRYYFDRIRQRLVGESHGQIYQLGDRVEVYLKSVNMKRRRINLILISSKHISSLFLRDSCKKEKI